jgi:hypothetical protein
MVLDEYNINMKNLRGSMGKMQNNLRDKDEDIELLRIDLRRAHEEIEQMQLINQTLMNNND